MAADKAGLAEIAVMDGRFFVVAVRILVLQKLTEDETQDL